MIFNKHKSNSLKTTRYLTIVVFFILSLTFTSGYSTLHPSEHLVKAAFVYNIIKFVDWPDEEKNQISVCVYGKKEVQESISPLSTKTAKRLPIVLHNISASHNVSICDVIYISKTKSHGSNKLLTMSSSHAILTISDIDNFAHEGGMIELATVSNSIKMIINLNTSRRAGLMLSSKLLELGSVIDQ